MSLLLRYMRLTDVPQVVAIDQMSFVPPWSARSYAYEIAESTYSHMVVLDQVEAVPNSSLWRRIFGTQREPSHRVVAYGGLWNIVDEAHISTIASHPEMRGRGLGEIVLAGMIQKAITLFATYIVLEVRVSNVAAQNLYRKYDFVTVDVKKGYYHNNGEDAYDMRLDLCDSGVRARFEHRLHELRARVPFEDQFTTVGRER